ncbi:hypothetical protein [Sphingobium sp. CAP-1]|uniref:hypothetical protein n=1 Tax=Sphingobium sp. CAP-1 TaxID=2676077 RepID=UPI0012BB36CE|nr:hypothetical protein [Sphingobium sp. CAP-1]QGP80917.1 hypothetical protein GL174_17745 [Sphingobium sp. CAP-1]
MTPLLLWTALAAPAFPAMPAIPIVAESAADPRVRVNVVRAGTAIEAAVRSGQSGLFILCRAELGADGPVEAIGVVDAGRIVDIFARRRGQILRRMFSPMAHIYRPADYGRLLGFGIDVAIGDPARRAAFETIVRTAGLPSSSGLIVRPDAAPPGALLFFDRPPRPFFARWGFEYGAGATFTLNIGSERTMFALK